MKERRLKKSVIPAIYGILTFAFVGTIITIETTMNKDILEGDNFDYVGETIFEADSPVINETPVNQNEEIIFIKPFTDPEVKTIKGFYEYDADVEIQENSIIYHEGTYLQNTGIVYGGKEHFEVVAILDGEVSDIKNDELLGTIIEIKHNQEITSIYQSLSEVTVNVGDIVSRGQVIGKSGTSNIDASLSDHLLFELIIKGKTVNPENYYGKKVSEI